MNINELTGAEQMSAVIFGTQHKVAFRRWKVSAAGLLLQVYVPGNWTSPSDPFEAYFDLTS